MKCNFFQIFRLCLTIQGFARPCPGQGVGVGDFGGREDLCSFRQKWRDFLSCATEWEDELPGNQNYHTGSWAYREKRARMDAGEWMAREWTGVAGSEGEEAVVSLELLPATKGVYRLAGCQINGGGARGGEITAILVTDRSEMNKSRPLARDQSLPTSCFLSRAMYNVVFRVHMDSGGDDFCQSGARQLRKNPYDVPRTEKSVRDWHKASASDWRKAYAGDFATISALPSSRWLSTFPGQEQYDCQRAKDVAATHERFPGSELGEVREKILIQRDLHRLGWSVSSRSNEPEAHVLEGCANYHDCNRVGELLKLLQDVEKATTPDPAGNTTGATGGALSDLFLRSEKLISARKNARAAFFQQLEKNTNAEAGLAPLVKSVLTQRSAGTARGGVQKKKIRGNIMLVPAEGDPASVEPCRPEDRLLELLMSKNVDGSARGGWKWLGPDRVEMQFHAMIQ